MQHIPSGVFNVREFVTISLPAYHVLRLLAEDAHRTGLSRTVLANKISHVCPSRVLYTEMDKLGEIGLIRFSFSTNRVQLTGEGEKVWELRIFHVVREDTPIYPMSESKEERNNDEKAEG